MSKYDCNLDNYFSYVNQLIILNIFITIGTWNFVIVA